MRERGLKPPMLVHSLPVPASFPVRERGLKQCWFIRQIVIITSFPVRERGLKRKKNSMFKKLWKVVPRAGTWIETHRSDSGRRSYCVVPRAGTWIETDIVSGFLSFDWASFPVRERGLKPIIQTTL